MKKSMVMLMLTALVPAAGAGVNFDRGVDVKSAIAEAASADIQVPEVKAAGRVSYTRGCGEFTFVSPGEEATSGIVRLASTEMVEICQPSGWSVTSGAGGFTPGGMDCHTVPGMTWRRGVRVHIGARPLLPWETETFEACLEGKTLEIHAVKAAYKYDISLKGGQEALFDLAPLAKIPSAPDEAGLSVGSFSYDTGSKKFRFFVNDWWAKEYSGEKVSVKLELYRDVSSWIDTFKGGREFTFDTARGYEMKFSLDELALPELPPGVSPVNNGSPQGPMPPAKGVEQRGMKSYYIKWGFTRIGGTSTDKRVDKGETSRVIVD